MQRNSALALLIFGSGLYGQTLPDLQPVALDRSRVITDGQTLAASGLVTVALRNNGAAFNGTFRILVWEERNGNSQFDPADQAVGSLLFTGTLANSAQQDLQIPVSGTLRFRGNLLSIAVDTDNAVTESNESNNVISSTQASTAGEPFVLRGSHDSVNVPRSIAPNGRYAYLCTDENIDVLDLIRLDRPTRVNSIADDVLSAAGVATCEISGNRLYLFADTGSTLIAGSEAHVSVYDLTDPANPVRLGSGALRKRFFSGRIAIQGTTAFVPTSSIGWAFDGWFGWFLGFVGQSGDLLSVDISNPASIRILQSVSFRQACAQPPEL